MAMHWRRAVSWGLLVGSRKEKAKVAAKLGGDTHQRSTRLRKGGVYACIIDATSWRGRWTLRSG